MLERIKAFNKEKTDLAKDLETFVKDKSVPLEERWNCFMEAGIGKELSWVQNFKSLNEALGEVSWYDDFYLEKMQTLEMAEAVVRFSEKEGVTDEQVNAFQEEILEKFLWSFTYDW